MSSGLSDMAFCFVLIRASKSRSQLLYKFQARMIIKGKGNYVNLHNDEFEQALEKKIRGNSISAFSPGKVDKVHTFMQRGVASE